MNWKAKMPNDLTEIIISNIIATGTGFAVVADDMHEGVFVPSRVMHDSNLRPGDRASAMLVPNTTRPDKTPWLAVSLVSDRAPAPVSPRDTLAAFILGNLQADGRATVDEIAEDLNMSDAVVAAKLAEMVADGRVVRLVCFDLPGDE
jgi:hypothetical protein